MIRPEDVRWAAILAAREAFSRAYLQPETKDSCALTAAIDAYERALWQPVQRDNPPLGDVLVGVPNAEPGFRGRAYHLGAAHWAQDLSGEEQPPFKGWYRPIVDDKGKTLMFAEINGTPAWWRPEPPQPGEVKK